METYLKIYPSFFTGTLRRETVECRLLFLAMATLADRYGQVHGTPDFFAAFTNLSEAAVVSALERLQAEDPDSTSAAEGGRRVLCIGPNLYRVVNKESYFTKGMTPQQQAYHREWKRKKRAAEPEKIDTLDNGLSKSVYACPDKRKEKKRKETTLAQSNSQKAAKSSAPPPVRRENDHYVVSNEMMEIWRKAYPGVDLGAELAKAFSWEATNPKRRKTERGLPRFLNTWMEKAQNQPSAAARQRLAADAPLPACGGSPTARVATAAIPHSEKIQERKKAEDLLAGLGRLRYNSLNQNETEGGRGNDGE